MSKRITFSGTGTAIVAVLCLVFGIFLGSKMHPGKNGMSPVVTVDTIIIHDTIPGDPFPVLITHNIPVVDTIILRDSFPQQIDTAALMADYFATRVYEDTLTDDTSFLAIIREEISENRIIDREYWHRNLRPIAINATVIKQSEWPRICAGAYIGYGAKVGIGIQGSYHPPDTRKTFIGTIGTDGVRVGVMWNITKPSRSSGP